MIWSIIPDDIIFKDNNNEQIVKKIKYLDRDVLVNYQKDGKGRIVSVLSTDPFDYLDQRLNPEQSLTMTIRYYLRCYQTNIYNN